MRRIPILPLVVFAFLVSMVAAPLSASADGVIVVDPPAVRSRLSGPRPHRRSARASGPTASTSPLPIR